MRLTGLLFILLLVSSKAFSQTPSCCKPNISAKNAALASNEDFAATHINPLPFMLENAKGEKVEFACSDGKSAFGYLVKSARPSKKFLFVFHEWWGLNDYIKKEADKLSMDLKDVNILAIDLYDGNVGATREEAQKLVGEMKQERSEAIVKGAFDYVGKKAKIATLGWCMGGSWSLQAAITGGKNVKACVMYYGFPEENTERLKKIKCEILGIFAEKDQFINVKVVKQFEDNLKNEGKKITVYNYVADHAFANPSNPQYNEVATKDAYDKVMTFLRVKMKSKKVGSKN